MSALLHFEFLAILNLFTLVAWGGIGPFATPSDGRRYHPLTIIMLILTALAVVLDIFFLVLKVVHG